MRTSSRSFRHRASLVFVAAAFLGAATLGCGPGPDGQSGGDQERAAAVAVPVGQAFDDRVSASEGDRTDWKRFRIEDADQVNVAVYWDDPDVEASIEVRNAFGNALGRREHAKGEPVDRLSATLEEGDYFLAITAEGGGSVYTLEITTGEPSTGAGKAPKPRRGGGGADDARPE